MSSPQKWPGYRFKTDPGTGIKLGIPVEAIKKALEYSGFSKFVENPHPFEGHT